MDNSNALRDIFEREQGTLRYGHALRLLGNYNPSLLRDLIDALGTVQTKEQLWLALAWAVQECQIAFARTDFIIIPDDDDLKQLTEDIEKHTAPTIASLLIILSVLRYARTTKVTEAENVEANEGEANPQ